MTPPPTNTITCCRGAPPMLRHSRSRRPGKPPDEEFPELPLDESDSPPPATLPLRTVELDIDDRS